MSSQFKKTLSIMMLTTSIVSGVIIISPFSTVSAMEAAATPLTTSDYGVLSESLQNQLKIQGHAILSEILSDEGLDLATSGIFDQLNPLLEPELTKAQYSTAANFAPSNAARWWWSSGDANYIAIRKNQLCAMIAVSWSITDLADQQHEHFVRGSFTLIDPHHRLYSFFLDYVKRTTGFANPQDVPFAQTASNFAYRREPNIGGSSHYKGHCPESQFGIDVRFDPWGGAYKLLPFDCTHLLFAKLDIGGQAEPLMFLKFEPIGMGSVGAIAAHGLAFLNSKSPVASDTRREKDIRPDIKEAFAVFKRAVSLSGEPKHVRPMVLEAEDIMEKTRAAKQDYMDSKKLLDHSAFELQTGEIFDLLNDGMDDKKKQNDLYDKSETFLNKVDEIYPQGNNHLRIGNEVIIDLR